LASGSVSDNACHFLKPMGKTQVDGSGYYSNGICFNQILTCSAVAPQ
jgi:hypothetical protein